MPLMWSKSKIRQMPTLTNVAAFFQEIPRKYEQNVIINDLKQYYGMATGVNKKTTGALSQEEMPYLEIAFTHDNIINFMYL